MSVMLSLSVSTSGNLKSLLDRDGNRTRDLWVYSSNAPPWTQICTISHRSKAE
jgi:hypothetical protein